jgi:Ca2+-transporting ATPase
VVGAPDILLTRSSRVLNAQDEPIAITSEKRFELAERLQQHAALGQRLVGVAVRRNVSLDRIQHEDIGDLLFLGVLGITDPVRADVPGVVAQTLSAGIAVKLITGDHPQTAAAIARTVGLPAEEVITSDDLDHLNDEELRQVLQTTSVFARITPLDKQRIVRALQDQGEVVAMTGDGINDAVALKSADIGVAMGSGKDIAKQAADLVLLDDSFATIVAAVYEGRVLRDNLRKVIAFLLATNSAEVAIFFVSLVTGLPLPLLPAQILWINLVTDGTSDIALSLEPGERDVMQRKPEDPRAPLISAQLLGQIVFAGLVVTAGAMALYWHALSVRGIDLTHARTLTFTFVSVASLLSVWSFRSLRESLWRRGLWGNTWVPVSLGVSLSLQLLAIYVPPLQRFFDTVPLNRQDWLCIIVAALITLIIMDFRKTLLPRLWKHLRAGRETGGKTSLAPTS